MQLYFQTYGAGSPLVILHGLFGSSDNWQPVGRRLGESFQVFTVDLRNHGRSPHAEEFNYEVMAEDLREFMEQRQLAKINVLGHSMGGKVAMHFALRYPELVEKLIVLDMAPRAYAPVHVPYFEAMLALDLGTFRERREIEVALEPAIPEISVRQFLLKNVGRDEAGAFRWKLNLPVIYRNYAGLNLAIEPERTFEGPAHFIRGERSDYVREEDGGLIRALFPKAIITTIPKAGHWVHADQGEKLVETVNDWLR